MLLLKFTELQCKHVFTHCTTAQWSELSASCQNRIWVKTPPAAAAAAAAAVAAAPPAAADAAVTLSRLSF